MEFGSRPPPDDAIAQPLAINMFMPNACRSWADSAGWIGAVRSALGACPHASTGRRMTFDHDSSNRR